MTDSDKVFSGSIPALCDGPLVPLIFEAVAADIAGRVAASSRSVLEMAAEGIRC